MTGSADSPPRREAVHADNALDDWGIGALTPEARIYQEVGEDVTLRVRYRYYNQLRSFFYRPDQQYMFSEPRRACSGRSSGVSG